MESSTSSVGTLSFCTQQAPLVTIHTNHTNELTKSPLSEAAFTILFHNMCLHLKHGTLSELDIKDLYALSTINKFCNKRVSDVFESLIKYLEISTQNIKMSINDQNRMSLSIINEFLKETCSKIKKSHLPLCVTNNVAIFNIIKNNYYNIFMLFISSVVNINAVTRIYGENPKTLLTYATELEDSRYFNALIRAGADIEVCNSIGQSALALALISESCERVQTLLNAGASPIVAASETYTPFMLAIDRRNTAISAMIISAIANYGHINDKHHCYGSLEGSYGSCASSDFENPYRCSWTPLMYAVTMENVECVRMCLEAGADINTTDRNKSTALMRAAERCHQQVVQLLIGAGADVNLRDMQGQTALGIAKKCLQIRPDEEDSIQLLLMNRKGNPREIIQMLENVGAIE